MIRIVPNGDDVHELTESQFKIDQLQKRIDNHDAQIKMMAAERDKYVQEMAALKVELHEAASAVRVLLDFETKWGRK